MVEFDPGGSSYFFRSYESRIQLFIHNNSYVKTCSPFFIEVVNGVNRLLLRVEEHRTRHQNGTGKRETLSLIYDKCMQPGSRNRDKLMH